MKKNNRIELTTYSNSDAHEGHCNTVNFSIPYKWLDSYTKRNEWGSVEDFLNEYTWDDSEIIFDIAESDGVLKVKE